MSPVAEHKLTKEEFHARYDGEKPYYEYWDGETVKKAGGTWCHGITLGVLTGLLDELGYHSVPGVTLHLDPLYELIPDIVALEEPLRADYPTEPFEVVIEVLLPEDHFSRIMRKCNLYEKWGIRQIVLVDPHDRLAWRFASGSLRETDVIASKGNMKIRASAVWAEVYEHFKP
jgi:Uma2 family endonuclease